MVEKLNVILKDLKERYSTLFQFNGLALKQGENFVHSLNVKQIKCVDAKLTKVRQDIEAPEHKRPGEVIMYLLTEWEGRTGKYLARGQSVRTERSEVRSPDWEPNIFPSGPTLLSQ